MSLATARTAPDSGRRDRVLTDRGSEYCGNPERHEAAQPMPVAKKIMSVRGGRGDCA